MLTVWRKLHVEKDSMEDITSINKVTGNLAGVDGTATKATKVTLSPNLETGLPTGPDNSVNLDSATPKNGRFEKGTIQIGVGSGTPGKTSTGNLEGNGDDYVKTSAGIDIPFKVSKPGQADCSGNVVSFANSTKKFGLNVSSGVLVAGHNGGTLNVAGVSMTISSVDAATKEVVVSALSDIPFELVDDDTHTLPTWPDLGLMDQLYQPAYIRQADDGGGNAANNTQTVNAEINLSQNTDAALKDMMKVGIASSAGSDGDRADDYWIAYVCSAYQKLTAQDYDPDSSTPPEFGPLGTTPGAEPMLGCCIWQESIDDFIKQAAYPGAPAVFAAWAGQRQKLEQRCVVHESAHLFNILDLTGGIMSNAFMNDELCDEDGDVKFTDAQLDTMRTRVKSPGK